MKLKHLFLIVGLVVSIFSIALILIKGSPKDMVNFDSVVEVAESMLHHVAKTGHILTSVSDQEEMGIGDKIHEKTQKAQIAKNIEDSPLDKYVTVVGLKVAENIKRKDIKYKFHIIDSYWPNAFSGPGGHVYISIGLLKKIESEAELAAILGHEITHVDAKHAIGLIQYKIKTEKAVGSDMDTIVDIGYQVLFRPGYSEVQESEADLGGVFLAYKAGYHPIAVVSAFENINKAELSRTGVNRSITPVGDTLNAVWGVIDRYFMMHPLTTERIDNIKKYIADNKMLNGSQKFYIGYKNYIEKISYSKKAYREELSVEYAIPEEERETIDIKPEEAPKEEVLTELYTVYGKLYVGMNIKDVEKMLPEKSKKVNQETYVGYKDIGIYKFNTKELQETAGIWLEFKKGKVTEIRIIK